MRNPISRVRSVTDPDQHASGAQSGVLRFSTDVHVRAGETMPLSVSLAVEGKK